VTKRRLRAVLVDRATPRFTELLAGALDASGPGPAIVPLDAGLPAVRLEALLRALDPDEVEDGGGVTTVSSGRGGVSEDTAVIICTSGSTGEPKGVELSAAAMLYSALASLDRIGAGPGERWLCCLPVTHIAGIQVLVRSLAAGAEPYLAGAHEGPLPQTIAAGAAAGCRHLSLVPTQLTRLEPEALAGYRTILLGGAAAADGQVDRARAAGLPVVTTYGMSETCGGCVYDGIPLDGVRAEARDEDGGRIWIAGPVLFQRYTAFPGRAGLPAQAGGPAGDWFRTGDLGALDAAGRLVVRGRADDVINTGGHKVVPAEVATVLQACPGVRDAAVLGQSHPEWGEQVVAVIVPADPRDPPTLKMLRMHVKERLPRYAAPSRVVLVDAVPMLPSGKPDLMRLRRDLTDR
jgi:o-succinylbenzoate---CoA ligase